MTNDGLQYVWSSVLGQDPPTVDALNRLAQSIEEVYAVDLRFREHIRNRFNRVTEHTGQTLDPEQFTIAMARAFVADEIGFRTWEKLTDFVRTRKGDEYPILFKYAIAALERGDFTAVEITVGGPHSFEDQIKAWLHAGYLAKEPETMAECFAAACMLGHAGAASVLLDAGVDPYAGMRTGLAGFHYAASSGRLDVVKLLISRHVPMEIKNMYGGTVFDQAMWSAVNEWTPDHAAIVEELVMAGATVDSGYVEWWDGQEVIDVETQRRVAKVLQQHRDFYAGIATAQRAVERAELEGTLREVADALKALGNLLRRPPFGRAAANEAYERAAALYDDLGLPLETAWVKRHIGINHEYAGRLHEAERYYDEALELYRRFALDDDPNYANTVRYPAVIKERLGKRDEAAKLWEEAHDRYARIIPGGLCEGEAEAAAWLTILAMERGDQELASEWFRKAAKASSRSDDADTHAFIEKVKARLESAGNPKA